MTNSTSTPRGFTRIDLLGTIGCIAVVGALASVMFGQSTNKAGVPASNSLHPKTLKDATQMRGIHQTFLVFSREFQGIFPRPGLINRLADPTTGQQTPGRGPENIETNTTANLYSAIIMQNYITPELVISPIERSPHVKVKAGDKYNWEAYNVTKDVYWDENFKADLSEESNVSYAHVPIYGERGLKQWRESLDAKYAALGNRGPKDGQVDPSSVTCGPHGHWEGNVVFNDNHTMFQTSPTPDGLLFGDAGQQKPDNIFAMEQGPDGMDVILAFTKKMTAKGPELQWD